MQGMNAIELPSGVKYCQLVDILPQLNNLPELLCHSETVLPMAAQCNFLSRPLFYSCKVKLINEKTYVLSRCKTTLYLINDLRGIGLVHGPA